MGSHITPFLLFGGVAPAATFILRSGASADAYLLESGTDKYQLEDASGIYELEGAGGGGGNILRSPDDGSKIERSD